MGERKTKKETSSRYSSDKRDTRNNNRNNSSFENLGDFEIDLDIDFDSPQNDSLANNEKHEPNGNSDGLAESKRKIESHESEDCTYKFFELFYRKMGNGSLENDSTDFKISKKRLKRRSDENRIAESSPLKQSRSLSPKYHDNRNSPIDSNVHNGNSDFAGTDPTLSKKYDMLKKLRDRRIDESTTIKISK